MKKLLLIIAIVCCFSCSLLVLGGCGKKVTFSYETNCDLNVSSETVKKGSEYTLPTPPSRGESWEFLGWYDNESLTGDIVVSTIADTNVTYYAKWEQLYLLKLDLVGGTASTSTERYLKKSADVVALVNDITPEKNGCQFGGWMLDGKDLPSSFKMPENDITITAKYKVGYTIDFYKQNASLDGYDKESVTRYDYASNDFIIDYAVEGFVLADNSANSIAGKLSENPQSGENHFVAYLDRVEYTLTLDNNAPDESDSQKTYTLHYGVPFELPFATKQYSGYIFEGWSDTPWDEIKYPMMNINSLVYNDNGQAEDGEKIYYYAEKNATLYARWMQGYNDMFGGGDYIFLLNEEDEYVYLERGGKYFKGEYDAYSREFAFINGKDEMVFEGKLLDGGIFCYNDSAREGFVVKSYTIVGGINDSITLMFGAFNKVTYTVVDEEGKSSSSIGSFILNDSGEFEVTYTTGELQGQKDTYILRSVTNSSQETVNVFLTKNDKEFNYGTIVRLIVSGNRVLSYKPEYYAVTLSGYGFGTFLNGTTAVTCYYMYDEESDTYTLINASNYQTIGEIKLFTESDTVGYMFYNSILVNTFTAENGNTLTLDGTMIAEYDMGDKTIKGYYSLEQSYFGGYIVTLADASNSYKFILNAVTDGEGEETITSYVMQEKLNGYSEYYYYTGDGSLYAPILVINEEEDGDAVLYAYTKTKVFVKASRGSYTVDEKSGLLVYVTSETYELDESIVTTDVTGLKSFVFGIDESSYRIYYRYSEIANDDTNEKLYAVAYAPNPSQDEIKGESLELVAGFAFYTDSKDKKYVSQYSIDSTTGLMFFTITVDGNSQTVIFELDTDNKIFTKYEYSPFVAYVYKEDGTTNRNEKMEFDGKGGVTYTNGTETFVGKVVFTDEKTDMGYSLIEFAEESVANPHKFKFILMPIYSNYYYSILSDKAGIYRSEDGLLTLDGTGFSASYVDKNGDAFTGMYLVRNDSLIYIYVNGTYLYFDLHENNTFSVRGSEYGEYILLDNQSVSGKIVSLDGLGNLKIYELTDDTETYPDRRKYIDENGEYTISDDGAITLSYTEYSEEKQLVGRLSQFTYDNTIFNVFILTNTKIKGVYVNDEDFSVLVVDDIGNLIKYLKDGSVESGSYTVVNDDDYNIFYYVNDNGTDATLYKYDEDTGMVSYVNSRMMAYYNETLSSLQFTKYGYAIFDGTTRYYFYVEEDGNVAIYHRAGEGETGNKYGFVKEDFGKFENEVIYKGVKYYVNDGFSLTFNRKEDSKDIYPITINSGETSNKFPLEGLTFTPTGAAEFMVNGKVAIDGKDYECYVVRQIVDGIEQLYIVIGNYYRIDIDLKYDADPLKCTYEVTDMRYIISATSYYYLYNCYMIMMYYGESYLSLVPQFGDIVIWRQFDELGDDDGNWYMSGTFYEVSGVLDSNGEPISFEKQICQQNNGYFSVQFDYEDGYTYEGYFQLDFNTFGIPVYKMPIFARQQTFEQGDLILTITRIVASESQSYVLGDLGSISLASKNGEEIEDISSYKIFKIGEKFAYIVRNYDEDENLIGSTYYYITLTDPEIGDIEDTLVRPFESCTIEIVTTVATYFGEDGESSVDIDEDGNVIFIGYYNGRSVYYYTSTETQYNSETGIYLVTTKSGKKFTVRIVEGKAIIEEYIEETEE